MNPLLEMVFIGEIALQAKIAQRAAERLKAANDCFDRIEIWSSIQSILIAAGNVSKILWPSRLHKSRGERLRQMLNVEEDNILCNRTFRNHFERYDERIEEQFNKQQTSVYRDLAMNPSLQGTLPQNNHRVYSSFDNTSIFRGDILHLNEVLKALEDIHER